MFARKPPGDSTHRIHAARIHLRRFFKDILGYLGVVIDWIGVRHGAYRRKTAGSCGLAAGFYGLFVFKAGFPQMNMHVDKTGSDYFAGSINDSGFRIFIFCRKILFYLNNFTVRDQNIHYPV